MKFIKSLIFAAIFSLLAACSTQGYKKAEVTTAKMSDTREELVDGIKQIDVTVKALNSLSGKPKELENSYKWYVKEVNRLGEQAESVKATVKNMRKRRDEYLNSWLAEISSIESKDVRDLSEERYIETRQGFRRVSSELLAAKHAYRPLITDLRDIETHLSNDLNPKGVKAILDVIKQANENADILKKRIDHAILEIDKVSNKISPKS